MNSCISLLIFLIAVVSAQETFTGKIINSQFRSEWDQTDLQTIKVTLNYGQYVTYPRKDGTFQFQGVLPGKYIVQVASDKYLYEQATVEIFKGAGQEGKIMIQRVHPLTRKRPQAEGKEQGKARTASDYLILHQLEEIQYYEVKILTNLTITKVQEELTFASIYQNQYFFMVIMMVVMIFMVTKMPMEDLQNSTRAPAQQE